MIYIIIFGIVSFVCGYLAGKYMGHHDTIERLTKNREIDVKVLDREMRRML